jgi:aryl-alcohol dehydrogenase-like predicted oxidoreductase
MPMEYGTIAGVNKPLSRIVQGTIPLSTSRMAESFDLLDGVYEAGCRTFDTAQNYGNGDCERVLGSWIADRGVRDQVVILGKGAHPIDGRKRVTPEDIAEDLAGSLERLQTNFIDMYVLHRDDLDVPVGPIVEALNKHQAEGKIGIFGGSNWSVDRIKEANRYADEHGLKGFPISSPNFSLAVQIKAPWAGCLSISGEAGAADRAWYAEQGIPIFPWSSLAGGFFSGRFERDNLDTFTAPLDRLCVECYCSEENFMRLDRVKEIAARNGASIPQIAMSYVHSQPMSVFALVGCQKPSEFVDNVGALGHKLSQDEIAWLELRSDERPW